MATSSVVLNGASADHVGADARPKSNLTSPATGGLVENELSSSTAYG
jgi:hypothetical protein